MKCSICGSDENILQEQKTEALKQINIEITRILLEKETLVTKWKKENGFTNEICKELNGISDELKEITVSAFIENIASFLKLDNLLQKLY